MTRQRYEPQNIYYLRVFEYRQKAVIVCFNAAGKALPLVRISTDDNTQIVSFLNNHFYLAKHTTVIIIESATDRKYSIAKAFEKGLSRNVEILVPYVYQWTASKKPTGESYKNLDRPFEEAVTLLKKGFPFSHAIEKAMWITNLKLAWEGVDLEYFEEEMDCIRTDVKFQPFFPKFHAESGPLWSAAYMTSPEHLEWKKWIMAEQEKEDKNTRFRLWNKKEGRYEWVLAEDLIVRQDKNKAADFKKKLDTMKSSIEALTKEFDVLSGGKAK